MSLPALRTFILKKPFNSSKTLIRVQVKIFQKEKIKIYQNYKKYCNLPAGPSVNFKDNFKDNFPLYVFRFALASIPIWLSPIFC